MWWNLNYDSASFHFILNGCLIQFVPLDVQIWSCKSTSMSLCVDVNAIKISCIVGNIWRKKLEPVHLKHRKTSHKFTHLLTSPFFGTRIRTLRLQCQVHPSVGHLLNGGFLSNAVLGMNSKYWQLRCLCLFTCMGVFLLLPGTELAAVV